MSAEGKTDRERKINIALDKIKAYNSAGRLSEVLELSKGQLSENTIRSWIADGRKAHRAYKSDILIDIGSKIEPIGNKRWIAYEIAVSELCVSMNDQDKLNDYNGSYDAYHDISAKYTSDFSRITFGLKDNYRYFWTRYRSIDARRFCDGFIFIRGSKIVLAGTSKNVTLFASMRFFENDKFSLFGTLMIDDHKLQKTFSSKLAMRKRNQTTDADTHDRLLMYSMRSGYEV